MSSLTPNSIGLLFAFLATSFSTATALQDPPAPDEPPAKGLLEWKQGQAEDGFTLIAPLGSTETFLIDMKGEIVHAWGSAMAPGGPVYLMDNGNLLRPGRFEDNPRFNGGGIGGRLEEFDWDGFLVWEYQMADDRQTQHHDIELLPNGNLLVIVWKHHSSEEAIAKGRDPEVVLEKGLWSCSVLEIRPVRPDGGEVVWEWNSWDHLIQDVDPELANYGSVPQRPERIDINGDFRDLPPMTIEERKKMEEIERQMAALGYAGGDEDEEDGPSQRFERGKRSDWLHTNSVDHNARQDLIALSTPHMNEIWIIDHSTSTSEAASSSGGRFGKGGDLLYRWGNPRTYGAGNDADQVLFYQHNPEWLENSEPGVLRLLLYNNGRGRRDGDYSTVIELDLPFDPKRGFHREEGKAFGPEAPRWSWGGPDVLFAPFISGAQRLPGGNTLICEGPSGRLIEVTQGGDVVWEYVNEHAGEPAPKSDVAPSTPAGALFRATRIPKDAKALQGRELDTGD